MLCRKVCEAMYYENMPLYPGMRPPCDPSPCMKVRLFDDGCRGDRRAPPMKACERVVIDNPCRPGERAEVVLGMDDCGNLVICVHRLCGREPGGHSAPCCRPEPVCHHEYGHHPCDPWPKPPRPEPRGPSCNARRRHRPDWVCCH